MMRPQLQLGQRVRLKDGIETYGGLFGHIIHQERVTGSATYRREPPETTAPEGRLSLVVQLESPPAGVEPVILCSDEQVCQITTP